MSDYLDGQLSKADEDELRFHLNGCPRCRLKIEDMESSIRAVKSLPSVSPGLKFEQQLSNLLTREITRELYAGPWWRRVSTAVAELGELSRQRPVQLVFATSLVLTITVIGGYAELAKPPERSGATPASPMAFSVPTPFEPELAPPDPVSPFPFERELAPHMAATTARNRQQSTDLPTPQATTSLSSNTSRISGDRQGIKTVRTMEPTNNGIRFVLAGTGMRLDPSLFSESFARDLATSGGFEQPAVEDRLQPVGSAELRDSPGLPGSPDTAGSSGPSAPLRRVRISF